MCPGTTGFVSSPFLLLFGLSFASVGLMDFAFKYVEINNGIDTEESYPYTARNGQCHFKASDVGATVKSYKDVLPRRDEEALQEAVAKVSFATILILIF